MASYSKRWKRLFCATEQPGIGTLGAAWAVIAPPAPAKGGSGFAGPLGIRYLLSHLVARAVAVDQFQPVGGRHAGLRLADFAHRPVDRERIPKLPLLFYQVDRQHNGPVAFLVD